MPASIGWWVALLSPPPAGTQPTPRCLSLWSEVTRELTDMVSCRGTSCGTFSATNEHQAPPLTPFLLAPLPTVFIIYFLPALRGTPRPQLPTTPQPVPEALQMTSSVSVFIYRAYDFNFSIKKSKQG